MTLCVYVSMCDCVYTCPVCVHACVCVYIYTPLCVCTCPVCVYISLCVYMPLCVCKCPYSVYVLMCDYVCTCLVCVHGLCVYVPCVCTAEGPVRGTLVQGGWWGLPQRHGHRPGAGLGELPEGGGLAGWPLTFPTTGRGPARPHRAVCLLCVGAGCTLAPGVPAWVAPGAGSLGPAGPAPCG